MSALDDLLASRLTGAAASSQGQPQGPVQSLDDMLSARLAGAAAQQPQQPAPQPGIVQQTANRGVVGNVVDAVNSLEHNVFKPIHGLASLIQRGADYVGQQLPDNPISRQIHQNTLGDSQALAADEKQYQDRMGNSVGAYTGAIGGSIAPFLGGGATSALNTVGAVAKAPMAALAARVTGQGILPSVARGAVNTAGAVASGAAQGAASSLASPVDPLNPDDYWKQKADQLGLGALFGGVATPAISAGIGGVRAVIDALKPAIAPKSFAAGKILSEVTNAKPESSVSGQADVPAGPIAVQSVIDALRNSKPALPGSLPTSAQVAGSVPLLQVEHALRTTAPGLEAFTNRDLDNNAARWAAINGVAQTPEALAAAEAARSASSSPLYQAAHASAIPATDSFIALAQRPAMKTAFAAAKTMAANEGHAISTIDPEGGAGQEVTGLTLDYLKRGLDDQIGTAISAGEKQKVRALMGVKDQLQQFGEAEIPALREARQAYATGSVPVNTMEAGQQIAGKLAEKGQNVRGDSTIWLPAFISALKTATKDQNLSQDAEKALASVSQDLLLASRSNSLKQPGSHTAYNLSNAGAIGNMLYGPEFGGAGGAVQALSGGLGVLGGSMVPGYGMFAGGALGTAAATQVKKVGPIIGAKVNNALIDLMMNPQKLADALEKAKNSSASAKANAVASALKASPRVITNPAVNLYQQKPHDTQ